MTNDYLIRFTPSFVSFWKMTRFCRERACAPLLSRVTIAYRADAAAPDYFKRGAM
jgi:hypothetical protein